MAEGVTMIPFAGGSYAYQARFVSAQRSVNLYPENAAEGGAGRVGVVLAPTPGETREVTISTGQPCRGLWWSSTGPGGLPTLWGVFGDSVYRWGANQQVGAMEQPVRLSGNIGSGGAVSIADNGFVIAIADGTSLWIADLTADDADLALRAVQLPSLGGEVVKPSFVVFLASRLIINATSASNAALRNLFLFSNLNGTFPASDPNALRFTIQGTTAAQYYSAESSADPILSIAVAEGRLWLFGPTSYEVWGVSADETGDDPFGRIAGSANSIGTLAALSVAQIGGTVFWLGGAGKGRNQVFQADGMSPPVRVSTNALERRISQIVAASEAIGFAYADEGHLFYVLTFDSEGLTIVYDAATQLWHERSSRNWDDGTDGAWKPRFPVVGYDQKLFWGSDAGDLVTLDPETGTDLAGEPILRRRVGPVLWSSDRNVVIRDCVLGMEAGTTPELQGQSANPRAMLRISRDGGNTWHECGWRSFGRQGDYGRQVKWQNLGMGRSLVCDVEFSENFPFVLASMRVSVEECAR